jgi:hypothetical protein
MMSIAAHGDLPLQTRRVGVKDKLKIKRWRKCDAEDEVGLRCDDGALDHRLNAGGLRTVAL